jgi:hypothetical protein
MTLQKADQIDFRILDRPNAPVGKVVARETIIQERASRTKRLLVTKVRREIRVKNRWYSRQGSLANVG